MTDWCSVYNSTDDGLQQSVSRVTSGLLLHQGVIDYTGEETFAKEPRLAKLP